jgi:hypothetical protein
MFEGEGTDSSQLAKATKNASPARFTLDPVLIVGGTYTIRFRNKPANAIASADFGMVGEPDKTWVRVVASKDYVITFTVGDTTLRVFARQGFWPQPDRNERSRNDKGRRELACLERSV